MNNISDKEAIQKKADAFKFSELGCELHTKINCGDISANAFMDIVWQAAYESCLSEFEQVAQCYVNSDGECEEIEYTGSMEQWDDDFTPLFTRKG